MKLFIITVITFNFSLVVLGQNTDTIYWKENMQLKLEDFKATPISGKIKAVSHLDNQGKYKWNNDTIYIYKNLFCKIAIVV